MSREVHFFAGIGGIGMSALAKHLIAQGALVYGYDRQPSALTKELEGSGARIGYNTTAAELPKEVSDAEDLCVVYTPALGEDHPLLSHFRSLGVPLLKRSEFLQQILKHYQCWAVAGTHGKTTTSALLTHLLHSCSAQPTAFLGGVMNGLNSNYLEGNSRLCVAEADEFDRSFLRMEPACGIITSIDSDHLDIYGDDATYRSAFETFREQVLGPCVVHSSTGLHGTTYGLDAGDHRAVNIRVDNGAYLFDWIGPGFRESVRFHQAGRHNLENALAALALAAEMGMDPKELASGLRHFPGVRRRMDRIFSSDRHLYYDDYAHHPLELQALIEAIREWHPDNRLTLIFQPHLFSRTRDFLTEFSQALGRADELVLLPIYPAREAPIEGVTSERLLDGCGVKQSSLVEAEKLLDLLDERRPELLVTAGAGSIDRFVAPIRKAMEKW